MGTGTMNRKKNAYHSEHENAGAIDPVIAAVNAGVLIPAIEAENIGANANANDTADIDTALAEIAREREALRVKHTQALNRLFDMATAAVAANDETFAHEMNPHKTAIAEANAALEEIETRRQAEAERIIASFEAKGVNLFVLRSNNGLNNNEKQGGDDKEAKRAKALGLLIQTAKSGGMTTVMVKDINAQCGGGFPELLRKEIDAGQIVYVPKGKGSTLEWIGDVA